MTSGTARTLIEWVTGGDEGGAVPPNPGIRGSAKTAPKGRQSPPDFIQGKYLIVCGPRATLLFRSSQERPLPNRRPTQPREPRSLSAIRSAGSGVGGGSLNSNGSERNTDLGPPGAIRWRWQEEQ